MALLTAVGTFTVNAGTGNQSVTHTPGFGGQTGKVLILWAHGPTTNDTNSTSFKPSIGFSTSTTNRYTVSGWAREAQATSSTDSLAEAAAFISLTVAGAVQVQLDFVSFDTNGFTVNVVTANARQVNYMVLGGTDITNAAVLSSTAKTSTGTKAITGAGFTPTFAMHATCGGLTLGTPRADALFSIGAMTSAAQWSIAVASNDAAATAVANRQLSTTNALVGLTSAGLSDFEAAYSSFDADGCTLNWGNAAASLWQIITLVMAGPTFKVGTFAKSTSAAPVNQSVTGVGFTPGGVFLASQQSTAAATQTAALITMGAASAAGVEAAGCSTDKDTADPTDPNSRNVNDKVFIAIDDDGAGSINTEGDLSSFSGDGFDINWTTNSAAAIIIPYWAVSNGVTTIFVPPPNLPGRRLARPWRPRQMHVSPVEGWVDAAPEEIMLDKWWQRASEPKRFRRRPVPEGWFAANIEPIPDPPEDVTLDKWWAAASEPKRFRRRATWEGWFATDPAELLVDLDRWFRPASEPKRFERRATWEGLFSQNVEPLEIPVNMDHWFRPASEPKRFRRAIQPTGFFVQNLNEIPIPLDHWYRPPSEPKRRTERAFPQGWYVLVLTPEQAAEIHLSDVAYARIKGGYVIAVRVPGASITAEGRVQGATVTSTRVQGGYIP